MLPSIEHRRSSSQGIALIEGLQPAKAARYAAGNGREDVPARALLCQSQDAVKAVGATLDAGVADADMALIHSPRTVARTEGADAAAD